MNILHRNPVTVAPPSGQYSHAVSIPARAKMLFVSGQVGNRLDGTMAEGFADQLRQAFANLSAVLQSNDMTMMHIVKINYFLTSASQITEFREIRADYLPDPPPASTTVIASLLNREWLFEMDAVAAE